MNTKFKKPLWILTGVVIFILILWLAYTIHSANTLPIETVLIKGAPQQNQAEVKAALAPHLEQGLLRVNLDRIQKTLEQFPWVANVEVQRVWPHQLQITIQQQHLMGTWNDDAILNNYAESFPVGEINHSEQQLPAFYGPKGSQLEVMDRYQQMNNILELLNMKIMRIQLKSDNDWQITLNNGIKVQLGAQDILTRLRRFVKVYPEAAASHKSPPKSVDLRYGNGMAVRWKH